MLKKPSKEMEKTPIIKKIIKDQKLKLKRKHFQKNKLKL